jgi:hypothetical protein
MRGHEHACYNEESTYFTTSAALHMATATIILHTTLIAPHSLGPLHLALTGVSTSGPAPAAGPALASCPAPHMGSLPVAGAASAQQGPLFPGGAAAGRPLPPPLHPHPVPSSAAAPAGMCSHLQSLVGCRPQTLAGNLPPAQLGTAAAQAPVLGNRNAAAGLDRAAALAGPGNCWAAPAALGSWGGAGSPESAHTEPADTPPALDLCRRLQSPDLQTLAPGAG